MRKYGFVLFILVFQFTPTTRAEQEESEPAEVLSVIKSPSSVGEVTFPHQEHFEDFGLECETCHHETNGAELRTPHEEYFEDSGIDCKICHRESGSATLTAQTCSNCHRSFPANIADETLSAKVVIHKSCWECHEVGRGVEASKNCGLCHTGPRIELRPEIPQQ